MSREKTKKKRDFGIVLMKASRTNERNRGKKRWVGVGVGWSFHLGAKSPFI